MHVLHPRSRSTSTLFTTTLAVSFLVVALPHLLPCPVDRRQFADSGENADGVIRKRRAEEERRDDESRTTPAEVDDNGRGKRECPVPKPGGLVGQVMGFEQRKQQRPVEVVTRALGSKQSRGDGVHPESRP